MSLWVTANVGFDRLDRRVSNAPGGVPLAIVLLASLVLICYQHRVSYAMLLNMSAQRDGICNQAISLTTRSMSETGIFRQLSAPSQVHPVVYLNTQPREFHLVVPGLATQGEIVGLALCGISCKDNRWAVDRERNN